MPKEKDDAYRKSVQSQLGSLMIRIGVVGLWVPDPLPFVDELMFGGMIVGGTALVAHANLPTRASGGITQPDVYRPPVTSVPRMGGQVKKQIRSTSRKYYSRRKKYDYGKRKRY